MKKLANQGQYGTVYKFTLNTKNYILKRNDELDTDLLHEYEVMKELSKHKQLLGYFPQPRQFRTFKSKTVSSFSKRNDVQDLIMDYIPNTGTFYKLINHLTLDEKINIYNHLVAMLKDMQHFCQFVHYDLHLNNILLVKQQCKRNYVYGGKVAKGKYTPILIDFGFSHCTNVDGLRAPLTQTHVGMTPILFNSAYDIHTLQYELRHDLGFKISKWPRQKMSLFDFLCSVCQIESFNEETLEDYLEDDDQFITQSKASLKTIAEFKLVSKIQNLKAEFRDNIVFKTKLEDENCDSILFFWIEMFKKFYLLWLKNKIKW